MVTFNKSTWYNISKSNKVFEKKKSKFKLTLCPPDEKQIGNANTLYYKQNKSVRIYKFDNFQHILNYLFFYT